MILIAVNHYKIIKFQECQVYNCRFLIVKKKVLWNLKWDKKQRKNYCTACKNKVQNFVLMLLKMELKSNHYQNNKMNKNHRILNKLITKLKNWINMPQNLNNIWIKFKMEISNRLMFKVLSLILLICFHLTYWLKWIKKLMTSLINHQTNKK